MLIVGAISTNLEALILGNLLSVIEHGVGIMGAGLAFAAAAYLRRKNVLEGGEVTPNDG